ncbi:hypothetical protein OPIT5_07365 [Opitutaceae bacterium TAV5]|nr:hypothetical protein OPIT5_07365 [Opitutaceae bacterium TAV5]
MCFVGLFFPWFKKITAGFAGFVEDFLFSPASPAPCGYVFKVVG